MDKWMDGLIDWWIDLLIDILIYVELKSVKSYFRVTAGVSNIGKNYVKKYIPPKLKKILL